MDHDTETLFQLAADVNDMLLTALQSPDLSLTTDDLTKTKQSIVPLLNFLQKQQVIDQYNWSKLDEFLWERHEMVLAFNLTKKAILQTNPDRWTEQPSSWATHIWLQTTDDYHVLLAIIPDTGEGYALYAKAFLKDQTDVEQAMLVMRAKIYWTSVFLGKRLELQDTIHLASQLMTTKTSDHFNTANSTG